MARENAFVLKVLTGVQSGIEASLSEAEYIVGSGADDDLSFVDLSMKPGHARLKIEDGTIKIAGGSGDVTTRSGLNILTGDEDWRSIEPLDVITIGSTSFAIGTPSADWASLTTPTDPQTPAPQTPASEPKAAARPSIRRVASLTAMSFAALLAIGWFASGATTEGRATESATPAQDFSAVQSAMASFPFAKDVTVTQEVDGVIVASGYVDTAVERRALSGAIDDLAVPVRFRVLPRDVIKNEVGAIIDSQNVPVRFNLDPRGALTLRGDLLDDAAVDRLVASITDLVPGITGVQSEIKTLTSYLAEVQTLIDRSELDDTVLLRLDGDLIEASGVVVSAKIDNWVGFIQSYARRYADKVPLRSFVQLVDENGRVVSNPVAAQPGVPIVIGRGAGGGTANDTSQRAASNGAPIDLTEALSTETTDEGTDAGGTQSSPTPGSDVAADTSARAGNASDAVVLDLNRLKEGSFGAEDVFPGLSAQQNSTVAARGPQTPTDLTPPTRTPAPTRVSAIITGDAVISDDPGLRPSVLLNRASRPESIRGSQYLRDMTRYVLSDTDVSLETPSDISGLINRDAATETLAELTYLWGQALDQTMIDNSYLPYLRDGFVDQTECWANAVVTRGNLPQVLFWLDYMSVSQDFDVSLIGTDAQILLLEAALNPNRVFACAQSLTAPDGINLSNLSLYLNETLQNPEFLRFIVRKLGDYQLNLSGVNTGSRNRYIQSTDGIRIREGTSPTPSSLLVSVGELGLLIQEATGLSVTVYDASLHWKTGG